MWWKKARSLRLPLTAVAVAAAVITGSGAAAAAPDAVAAPAAAHVPAAAKTPKPASFTSKLSGYTITMVARKCPSYQDIMANRARNNIMESLQDLGKDSVYTDGEAVNPATEAANDPKCTALNGWQFELGSGYGKSGQFSHVTGSPLVVTGNTGTTALLNAQGRPTGKLISGAVVYHVTDQQYQLAQQGALWVQGGTVPYPQMENKFGDEYAFGVLRCVLDNQNADNAESAIFPAGSKNVFCYAYYVNPAPAAATVTIRKQVTGSGVSQGFTFASNLSYDPSGTFGLQVNNGAAASQDFIRAASVSFGGPYNVQEQVPPGWTLDSLTCSDTNGTSTWTITAGTGHVAITLAAGDHVTCTYTDSPPKAPTLVVWKVTHGAAGGPFQFTVAGPVGHTLTATTAASERPTEATAGGTSPTDYVPGNYTITEHLPAPSTAGTWHFSQVYCNSHALRPALSGRAVSVRVTLVLNVGEDCVFRNTWVPNGRLILRLETIGGTAHGTFLELGPADSSYQPFSGSTKHASVAETITDRNHLALGTWYANSLTPDTSPVNGSWDYVSFTCSRGVSTEPAKQLRKITLSAAHPLANCTAVYRFQPPTRVQLVKTASGPSYLRTGPAVVTVTCVSTVGKLLVADGTVVLARTAAKAELPTALVIQQPASCTVRETANGAVNPLNWSATATVNGKKLALPGTFTAAVPAKPSTYTVTVHNDYHLAVVPCRAGAGRIQPAC